MHLVLTLTLLHLATTPTRGNLLQAIVAFNKLDECTLLKDQQQVNLQFSPNVITDELQYTKEWIEKLYVKHNTEDNNNKLDSTTTAVFTPLLYKIDQLLETQKAVALSFQQLATSNRNKRAIKSVLLSLLSKSIVKAVKTTAISGLQAVLAEQFNNQADDEPQKHTQVSLYKSITKQLRHQLQQGEDGQHMLNKISSNTIRFIKALQTQPSQVKHTIMKAEYAQQHHLQLLHSIIKKTLDIDLATKLNIPQTIEDIQVNNINNSFHIKFTYFNTSTKITRVALDTASFNIDNTPHTIALPESIALISNTTYIKNPNLQCYTPQQTICTCTELNKLETIPPCLQQVIRAKKHLTHDPTLCAPHLIKTDTKLNVMRVKNNIFSLYSNLPRNYTIKCNDKPTSGTLTNGLNILSIPYECTLDTKDIKISNQVALPHQVGPSYSQINKDIDRVKNVLKHTNYSPKTEISVTDIILALVQLTTGLIIYIVLRRISLKSNEPSRLITPLPDFQQ